MPRKGVVQASMAREGGSLASIAGHGSIATKGPNLLWAEQVFGR